MSEEFDLADQLSARSPGSRVISDAQAGTILMRGFQRATEGMLEPSRYLRVGLCLSAGGAVKLGSGNTARELTWNKHKVFVTTPLEDAIFSSPDVEMMGLAVDLDHRDFAHLEPADRSHLLARPSFVVDDEVVRSVLFALWTTADKEAGSALFIQQGVELIVRRIAEAHSRPETDSQAPMMSQRQLDRLDDYIHTHMQNNLRIQDLSGVVGMSETLFSAAVKSLTGFAPFAYLTSIRMERAKDLIRTGQSITQVALAVGYTNPSKFAAAFKRFVGCTPTMWRRSYY